MTNEEKAILLISGMDSPAVQKKQIWKTSLVKPNACLKGGHIFGSYSWEQFKGGANNCTSTSIQFNSDSHCY